MKIKYKDIVLRNSSKILVQKCNEIIEEYATQGFTLTLRQLYYQLVSRDIIPNSQKSYKRVGSIVNDARLGSAATSTGKPSRIAQGIFAVSRIGRVRRISSSLFHYSSASICGKAKRIGLRYGSRKTPLVGVIEGVCNQYDVPFFSCRGYTSQSEMWGAAQRLKNHALGGQIPYILHFGDHDPSGKDMTRDIGERLTMFIGDGAVELHRMALNMDQIKKYDPPPNPAKQTDSRYEAYIREFGDESWELDALEPRVIAALIRTRLDSLINKKLWNEQKKKIKEGRATLALISARFPDVETFLEDAA